MEKEFNSQGMTPPITSPPLPTITPATHNPNWYHMVCWFAFVKPIVLPFGNEAPLGVVVNQQTAI